jgi:predicted aldo/keto reductase-like oxidoreductase
MKYRKMGSLPWEVSALGFGAMRLPTKGLFRGVDEKATIDMLRHGIDSGINYIDTAWPYHMGQSEKAVGRALLDGYREKVHLVTKLPMFMVRTEDAFDKYLNEQLERLKTDHLDVYLFHMLNHAEFEKVKRLNLLAKMEKARADGKILHIGFSFHDTLPVFKSIIDFYPWDMTLIQYNYMDTALQATTEGLRYAHGKGIAVVAMEPLKGGQLANPPVEAMEVIDRAVVKRTPVDWALQFLWNQPEISCVLSGMSSKKMVEDNCTSASASGIHSLSTDENNVIGELVEIFRKKVIVQCTACQYCMPCPYGVEIPHNFALLNNKSFGSSGKFSSRVIQWLITRNYKKLSKNKAAALGNNNRGRASLCTRCGACLPKCPQQIKIPDMLEQVVAVFEKNVAIDGLR